MAIKQKKQHALYQISSWLARCTAVDKLVWLKQKWCHRKEKTEAKTKTIVSSIQVFNCFQCFFFISVLNECFTGHIKQRGEKQEVFCAFHLLFNVTSLCRLPKELTERLTTCQASLCERIITQSSLVPLRSRILPHTVWKTF